MIFKNWSLALITAALVAPLSAGALGVSIESTSVTGAGNVLNMVSLTQAQYDSLAAPLATTLYIITD